MAKRKRKQQRKRKRTFKPPQRVISPIDDLDYPLTGAKEIGQPFGLTPRRTYKLLEARQLPATKIGGRWISTKRRLIARLNEGLPTEPAKPVHVPRSRKQRLVPRGEASAIV